MNIPEGLTNLSLGVVPSFSHEPIDINSVRCRWDFLFNTFPKVHPSSSISLTISYVDPQFGSAWLISDPLEGHPFLFKRSRINFKRVTVENSAGLLGLSDLDLSKSSVILTEGVSDYLTARILCPDSNVLGLTSLGGSASARKILISLFTEVLYISDNDSAGLSAASSLKSFLNSHSVSCSIFLPPSKDLTESFLRIMK